ncbi:MAG: hypothetical protein M8467_18595 [Anaerolineae bacterium]|nr:hypothetical protein [Anaerolineae bacterium]
MFFRKLHRAIEIGHLIIGLVFVLCALALLIFALLRLWTGIDPFAADDVTGRVDEILSGIAILTIALATLELGQTIVEEEVQRATVMSAPTRVRRFLSRFMVVLVVALSIEALVNVFQFSHTDPAMLPQAALVGFMAAVLLAAWGLFVRLNQGAERMEPEALQRVRAEDRRVAGEDLDTGSQEAKGEDPDQGP